MLLKNKWVLPLSLTIIMATLACNLPMYVSPTPFVFPTAGVATQKAPELFPTQTLPDTAVLATNTPLPTATPLPTSTPLPSATPLPSSTPLPVNTLPPPPPPPPVTVVPPAHRSGPYIEAQYVTTPPTIDGGWGDWIAAEYPANYVVYGADRWSNSADLSASFKVEWDKNYLYIAYKVNDSKYVQESKGNYLYEGDSVEILLDTAVQYDYWYRYLDWDDYQIGVSPGYQTLGNNPEAFVWFPNAKTGSTTKVKVGVKTYADGYRVSMAIPWTLLNVDPYNGARFGFAASVSDDDSASGGNQQSMVSSSSNRILTDPTTWGDLILVK